MAAPLVRDLRARRDQILLGELVLIERVRHSLVGQKLVVIEDRKSVV